MAEELGTKKGRASVSRSPEGASCRSVIEQKNPARPGARGEDWAAGSPHFFPPFSSLRPGTFCSAIHRLSVLSEALEIAAKTPGRSHEAELYRLKGADARPG
jgi:hypothetical protein